MTGPGIVFTLVLVFSAAAGATGIFQAHPRAQADRGVAANGRLSSVAGALLLVLSAGIGVTILRIGDLLPEHYLIGLLMLGPLALKLGSTGYRFAGYYMGRPAYRRAGPPAQMLRLTAPILVAASIAVFGTGIELWLFGYRYGAWWFQAHVVSFLVWTPSLAIHLLGHTRRSVRAVARPPDQESREPVTLRGLLLASLAFGTALALVSLIYASPFPSPAGSG